MKVEIDESDLPVRIHFSPEISHILQVMRKSEALFLVNEIHRALGLAPIDKTASELVESWRWGILDANTALTRDTI